MRVFITGATGFIGMAVTRELLAAGHEVIGLARSPERAAALAALGATTRLGTIEEPARLAGYAAEADGTIHLAFNHDFSRMAQVCEADRRVITAIGEALAGSGRPLIVTSGAAVATGVAGAPVTENDLPDGANPRGLSEDAALAFAARGVAASVMRLPQVHDPRRQGLITYMVAVAREQGVLSYVGDGTNGIAAAHVDDVARLYRLALEKPAGGVRYHAVDEEGVLVRDMCAAIGRRLQLPVRSVTPEEGQAIYGWLAMFLGRDLRASSAWTREMLGWEPRGPSMLEDLARLELD